MIFFFLLLYIFGNNLCNGNYTYGEEDGVLSSTSAALQLMQICKSGWVSVQESCSRGRQRYSWNFLISLWNLLVMESRLFLSIGIIMVNYKRYFSINGKLIFFFQLNDYFQSFKKNQIKYWNNLSQYLRHSPFLLS